MGSLYTSEALLRFAHRLRNEVYIRLRELPRLSERSRFLLVRDQTSLAMLKRGGQGRILSSMFTAERATSCCATCGRSIASVLSHALARNAGDDDTALVDVCG
jgi:hypothetical protein